MKVQLKSELKELELARRIVRETAASTGEEISQECVEELELAVTEAVTNVIKHAYHNELGHRIEFVCNYSADGIEILIHHWGESFDPANVPPPIFDGTSEGGFGLYIISKCVDVISFSTDKKNRKTIRLLKNRKFK